METNLKRMIARFVSIVIFLFSFVAAAADFYVTPTRAMRVPKMDRRKCRDLASVLRLAETNDTIHLASGTYNLPRKGFTLSTPVTILGGYSPDFKMRTPLARPSLISSSLVTTSHQAYARSSFFKLDFTSSTRAAAPATLILDGLTFDGAAFTNLAGRADARIDSRNLATRRGTRLYTSLLSGENSAAPLALTIRNCTFLNSYGPALQLNWNAGSLTITNNVFSNNWPFAVSLSGPSRGTSLPCTFTANTLPTHSLHLNFGLATNCAANIFTQPTVKPLSFELDDE